MKKYVGYVAEFDKKSILTGKNICKFYDVKTIDEARELAEGYQAICQAKSFNIEPMSDKFEVTKVAGSGAAVELWLAERKEV